MNRQPYGTPPRWWEPKLNPTWVKLTRGYRWRKLRNAQQLQSVDVEGGEHIRQAVADGQGMLVTPNHSAHYDSAALYIAFDQLAQPVHFMTAWQVFEMSTAFERWLMQRLGCFSIDRESTDRKAFKQAIDILRQAAYPLVIFPEGDIYHTTDRVTAFREGAAAIALSAAKRSDRPTVIVPCGIKFWYLEDPTDSLMALADRLELHFHLRAQPSLTLKQRIYRLAEAMLALKELDYLGHTRAGEVRERISFLTESVVAGLEEQYQLKSRDGTVPERVKELRQCIIRHVEQVPPTNSNPDQIHRQLQRHMDDLFFVMQLYSYPGNYLRDNPSIERIAETLDKIEEDVLDLEVPTVKGRRRVAIRFGQPIPVTTNNERKQSSADLTNTIQHAVQSLLDEINADSPSL